MTNVCMCKMSFFSNKKKKLVEKFAVCVVFVGELRCSRMLFRSDWLVENDALFLWCTWRRSFVDIDASVPGYVTGFEINNLQGTQTLSVLLMLCPYFNFEKKVLCCNQLMMIRKIHPFFYQASVKMILHWGKKKKKSKKIYYWLPFLNALFNG